MYDLSTHPYGCRVLQRCLEHLPESRTHVLMDELHKHTVKLMQDQFGVSLELWVYERAVDFDCTYRTMSFNMFLNMVDNRTGRLWSPSCVDRSSIWHDINLHPMSLRKLLCSLTRIAVGCSSMKWWLRRKRVLAPWLPWWRISLPVIVALCFRVLCFHISSADYVLQRALAVADGLQREALITELRPHLATMRGFSTAYSKHLNSSTSFS